MRASPVSDSKPPCRLYLVIPHDAGAESADVLAAALDAGDVACALLRCDADGRVDRAAAERLIAAALERGVAFLIEADTDAARTLGADGVHIPGDEGRYAAAREALGSEAFIGADCGGSRHGALTLAERGADYIAFSADGRGRDAMTREELLRWWAEVVEVPVVAWLARNPDEAAALARTGADFIAVGDAVWAHEAGPGEAVRAFNAALAGRRDAA